VGDMVKNLAFWTVLVASLIVAYLGLMAPAYRMPIHYGAIITRSIPLAIAWAFIFVFCVWRYKKLGLWLLVGAPMALYWPIWLLSNHLPSCYYTGNCV
jgi:hypothetical protein